MKEKAYDLDPETAKHVAMWLNGNYDEETKSKVRKLLQDNTSEAIDAFYTDLAFGTGGMRGIMGIGSNRLNFYTIRAATQGLANYIKTQGSMPHGHAAIIGYDCRHHSKEFAEEAAKVLAGNGIKVFLCEGIRPTPLISFGCRFLHCTTAIMITASHNPPEYNGYKVYWSDGGQVLAPHDIGITLEAAKITDPAMVKMAPNLDSPLITLICEEVDVPYIAEGSKFQLYPSDNKSKSDLLKVVYTSLHGTGITLMPQVFKAWGFTNIFYVEDQIIPDGSFPTVNYPNPEDLPALSLGVAKLKEIDGDIMVATDPDADRVGVVVKHKSAYVQLNGNQVAVILLDHICKALKSEGKLLENAAFIKTIVTTELFRKICLSYKKNCFDVLPGFKYIAEMIKKWEDEPQGFSFIFGGEESCGYLYNTLTRDKDGIIISVLLCEIALQAKLRTKTLVDFLHEIYQEHGVYIEGLTSLKFEESKAGKEKIVQSMKSLRRHLPRQINGIDVVQVDDYLTLEKKFLPSEKIQKMEFPESDVLTFWLADQTKLVIRPSGTEPKIKIYCGACSEVKTSVESTETLCKKRVDEMLNSLKVLISALRKYCESISTRHWRHWRCKKSQFRYRNLFGILCYFFNAKKGKRHKERKEETFLLRKFNYAIAFLLNNKLQLFKF